MINGLPLHWCPVTGQALKQPLALVKGTAKFEVKINCDIAYSSGVGGALQKRSNVLPVSMGLVYAHLHPHVWNTAGLSRNSLCR